MNEPTSLEPPLLEETPSTLEPSSPEPSTPEPPPVAVPAEVAELETVRMSPLPEPPQPVPSPPTVALGMPPQASRPGFQARFAAFVTERHPFAVDTATTALAVALRRSDDATYLPLPQRLDALREPFRQELLRRLPDRSDLPETTPGVVALARIARAAQDLADDCDGFLRREAIAASIKPEEKKELLRGMLLTRAVDNRLKAFFLGGDVRYGGKSFQGKGFRSLGQEAIVAAPLRLRRGERYRDGDGWRGDVVAPMIRDAGAAIAMGPPAKIVRRILSAQMGKAGPPMDGRDLHVGAWEDGVLPPAAPLGISSLNVAGVAFAMAKEGKKRVAVAFIGEGGTSLGEWHEAINVAAVHRLPAIFCVQNNQTALSTAVHEQCAARVFADKAAGYGIPGLTIDGTDPEAIAATFAWAAERAREGLGPTLVELIAMRMCGHAHHDDMLYLGKETPPSWDYPELHEGGYADRDAWAYWSERDPIRTYGDRLVAEGVVGHGDVERWKAEVEALVEAEARAVIEAPWPEDPGTGVFEGGPAAVHVEVLDPEERLRRDFERPPGLPELDPGAPVDPKGRTFLEAVMLGVGDALGADPRVFVYGEDVGGKYGNAFLLLRPLLGKYGDRIVNSPLTEAGTLGVAVGSALSGMRPIAEMQFNDFIATGFNQLVNNAAKIRYRWGGAVPMVVRMPWGGLRSAGPYHSQNTEPWFYRTPGLKIVVPSTPEDARAAMAAAVADPDPVLYYEHIALYRDPRIKQHLAEEAPAPLPLGKAALRRAGSDLAIVSYGAYVHVATRIADRLAESGVTVAVLDLRTLVPLDREALLRVARHCGKVLVVHEDSRTGGIGESLAAIIQEEAFEHLDAPVRILGALDTPVPYSPPLEQAFLPSEEQVERAARLLLAY